jgi:hypothetical protein
MKRDFAGTLPGSPGQLLLQPYANATGILSGQDRTLAKARDNLPASRKGR